ncbi:MAG: HPr kinase/phosphatase C-terminal domain-containing protein [Pseudomonadota bacterium]
MPEEMIFEGSGVAIGGQALLIEGPPGSGKSSLALSLIDRGASLIGDDAVRLVKQADRQPLAFPPPNIAGLLELHGIGIVEFETADCVQVSLVLSLGEAAEKQIDRLPAGPKHRDILGHTIPTLPFCPGTIAPAQRAKWALRQFGLM